MHQTRTLIALSWLMAVPTALAETSTIQVTGTFAASQSSDDSGQSHFASFLNQPFTLTFDYDTSRPDTSNSLNVGQWYHPVPSGQLVLASSGATFTEPTEYYITVSDFSSTYLVKGESDPPQLTGFTIPAGGQFDFSLYHDVAPEATSFLDDNGSNDILPDPPFFIGLPLDNAEVTISLSFDPPPGSELEEVFDEISGTVTSITVLPEPSSSTAAAQADRLIGLKRGETFTLDRQTGETSNFIPIDPRIQALPSDAIAQTYLPTDGLHYFVLNDTPESQLITFDPDTGLTSGVCMIDPVADASASIEFGAAADGYPLYMIGGGSNSDPRHHPHRGPRHRRRHTHRMDHCRCGGPRDRLQP